MKEQDMETQEKAFLEEAKNFLKENVVPAVEGRVCVDGRYDPQGPQKGFLARAGADFGLVMGLLALKRQGKINVTPKEAVDSIYDFVTLNKGKLFLHTDQASIDGQTLTGCGHARLASNPDYSDRFGVSATEMLEALSYTRNKQQHPDVEEVVLQGNHEEKGTLIVKGTKETLNHQGSGAQYFICDKTRDDEFIANFVNETNILGLNLDDFKQALEAQTNATLQLLAPEKPIIEVDLSGDTPKITFVGLTPTLNPQS